MTTTTFGETINHKPPVPGNGGFFVCISASCARKCSASIFIAKAGAYSMPRAKPQPVRLWDVSIGATADFFKFPGIDEHLLIQRFSQSWPVIL